SWNPLSGGFVSALSEDQGVIYLGGLGYLRAGGLLNGVGAISAVTGGPISWDPVLDGAARAIAVSNGTVYAGGSFARAAGKPRSYLAAIPAASAPPPPGPSISLSLSHPVPNPMRGNGTIDFYLNRDDDVWLDIFDLSGRQVRRILDRVRYPAGTHTVS